MQPDSHRYAKLARYLCAAYIAHQMGISPTTALKWHVSETPGEFWFRAAEAMTESMKQVPAQMLPTSSALPISTRIQ